MLDRMISTAAELATAVASIRISTAGRMTALRLKSWLPEHRYGSEPITLAGHSLPRRVGEISSGPMHVLCLAPAEWLVLGGELSRERNTEFQATLREPGFALSDWSGSLATFVIEGRMARALLSKGSGLDFDSQAFPPRRCARTRFAQIATIVQCLDESRFELFVARSYANYLHEWLIDAAAEWNIRSV